MGKIWLDVAGINRKGSGYPQTFPPQSIIECKHMCPIQVQLPHLSSWIAAVWAVESAISRGRGWPGGGFRDKCLRFPRHERSYEVHPLKWTLVLWDSKQWHSLRNTTLLLFYYASSIAAGFVSQVAETTEERSRLNRWSLRSSSNVLPRPLMHRPFVRRLDSYVCLRA